MMPTLDRSSTCCTRRRKKKNVIQNQPENRRSSCASVIQWKSEAQQRIYSSKLLHALGRVGARASSSAVREAADRVLAGRARGQWRWSRAILKRRRLKVGKFLKQKKSTGKQERGQLVMRRGAGGVQSKVRVRGLGSVGVGVEGKAQLLGRLVPGCRKQPLQVVLEEVIEYIPALEMQVRGMSAAAELLLSGWGAGSPMAAHTSSITPTSSPPPPIPISLQDIIGPVII